MKNSYLAFLGLLPATVSAYAQQQAEGNERPNIVWFLTEDVSSHYLAHFNEGRGAATPNVERLAQHGITFMNAYSCAPVSSAARTTLITGCYAPSFEGAFHRRFKAPDMPKGLNMFPAYLRRAGYYTCNAHKTDYNVKLDNTAWDEIEGSVESFQNRPNKSKPFFFMRTTMTTHEGRVQFKAPAYLTEPTQTSLDSVYLHPSLPDTRLMRYTYARFYDRITESDGELGEFIDILEQEGQMENTFIFYFGDNGGSLPGTKGYTNDIGFHVPLVVYVPEKWKHKVSQAYGSREDGLVSFMDFAPTVLNLAGVTVPERMDGTPFLGVDVDLEDRAVLGYGDRYDEFYAFNRCIRHGKYRYARNYQPNHPRSLFAFFRYKQLAFREWNDLYREGRLTPAQQRFFEPMGPEELYDLEADPYELHNLVEDPQYRPLVDSLRGELNQHLVEKADLGFFPETKILEEALPDAEGYGQRNRDKIEKYIALADLQLQPYSEEVDAALRAALTSSDVVERWWGLTNCAYFGEQVRGLDKELKRLMNDGRCFIRSKAMAVNAILGSRYEKSDFMKVLSGARTVADVLLALNDLTYLYENDLITPFTLSKAEMPVKNRFEEWRLKYLNSFVVTDHWDDRWRNIFDESVTKPLPVSPAENSRFLETFSDGTGGFTVDDRIAQEEAFPVWQRAGQNGDISMRADAFYHGQSHAAESWLVSPVIDLSGYRECGLTFDNAANFFTDGTDFSVMIKSEGKDWTELPLTDKAEGHSWTFVPTAASLQVYDGQSIQLAFVYRSSNITSGIWEVKNVQITGKHTTGISDLEIVPTSVIYDVNGRRVKTLRKGVYVVNKQKVLVD